MTHPVEARPVLNRVQGFTWAVFLISLPVTSFPFFPAGLGGGTLVRPLAIYPLLVLLILVTIPRLLKERLPATAVTFLPFVLVCVGSTLLAFLQGIEPTQGVNFSARMVRALSTLGLGSAIYLTVVLFPRTISDLRVSFRWVYAGLGLALLWGSLQAIYILRFSHPWFDWMSRAHQLISIRALFTTRVSGLTYEPNWFAEQIGFLYFPWLLASVLTRYSVFEWRWRWVTVEWLLLGWSILVLPFTYSRAGLFIMLVLASLSVLFLRPKEKIRTQTGKTLLGNLAARSFAAATLVLVLAGLVYFVGTKNAFFARLWDYWKRPPSAGYVSYLGDYFEYMGFGPRIVYGQTAYSIYEDHPILGVGLGNYAFYFSEHIPIRSLATMPEVMRLLVPEIDRDQLITTKNFYLRILAETGLVGAATFAAFLLAILGCALYPWFSQRPEHKVWGIAGLLGMTSFVLVAFSFDSLAIPNMWVVFGFITAAAGIYARLPESKREIT